MDVPFGTGASAIAKRSSRMLAGWVERSLRLKAPASSDLMIRRSTDSGERHARYLALHHFAVVFFAISPIRPSVEILVIRPLTA